jgi:DNA-binding response OmpR family regulator
MADIVLLEPDAVLAGIYRQAMEHAGHTVRRSVSAQDGVFQVDERLPDVVIVELQLVAHSGIEFLYELRSYREWQHIPVLIHSCIPPIEFEDSRQLLREMLHVRTYLYKPQTSLQSLLRAVREATGTDTSQEAAAIEQIEAANMVRTLTPRPQLS